MTGGAQGALRRAAGRLRDRQQAAAFRRGVVAEPQPGVVIVGNLPTTGFAVPGSGLGPGSAVYVAGAGPDGGVAPGIVARFGCTVHLYDADPRAADFVARVAAHEPRVDFQPVALWDRATTITVHAPRLGGYQAHQPTDQPESHESFSAPARSLEDALEENGHDHCDLLCVGVEGAEYRLIDHVLRRELDVRAMCLRWSQPAPLERVLESLERLRAAGYVPVARSGDATAWKTTLVRR
ncbi:MAG: Methyltransferase FkbM [Solirubrobacterales bacterium]|nr:Methyltransferase FkbM [Solirubrobacterales bacterium]